MVRLMSLAISGVATITLYPEISLLKPIVILLNTLASLPSLCLAHIFSNRSQSFLSHGPHTAAAVLYSIFCLNANRVSLYVNPVSCVPKVPVRIVGNLSPQCKSNRYSLFIPLHLLFGKMLVVTENIHNAQQLHDPKRSKYAWFCAAG